MALVMVMALTSCSDTKMEPSNEAFSTAANILNNESALVETIEIDAFLKDDPRTRIFLGTDNFQQALAKPFHLNL